jgi:mannose-6-phosphate isomerase
VHAIGGGIVLAEIQQTSDITYRVYDYDRVGTDGKPRELHTDLALDVMDLKPAKEALISYDRVANQANAVVNCPYFITNYLPVSGRADRDLSDRNAFTIYMCVEGAVSLQTGNDAVSLAKGMTAFIPAILKQVMLEGEGELLEITL